MNVKVLKGRREQEDLWPVKLNTLKVCVKLLNLYSWTADGLFMSFGSFQKILTDDWETRQFHQNKALKQTAAWGLIKLAKNGVNSIKLSYFAIPCYK